MDSMKAFSVGLGVAALMVVGLACGNGAEPRPTETNAASDAPQAEDQLTATLEIDGYGYTVGDVVQIETGRPDLDKVIIYDPFKNKSMCLSMGPDMSLGKIVGVPGETISFQNSGLTIRAETIRFDKDYSHLRAVFGGQKYSTLAEKTITLKDGEYLMDKRVGLECFAGEKDETGSSIFYFRFTVNEEAIIGVIVRKIAHDKEAEEKFRNRIY